jgi:hypothetical protein
MLDGKDLRQLPLLKRKQRLARLLTGHQRLPGMEYIPNDSRAMFAGALKVVCGRQPTLLDSGVWTAIRMCCCLG